jgi:hypothetical protein
LLARQEEYQTLTEIVGIREMPLLKIGSDVNRHRCRLVLAMWISSKTTGSYRKGIKESRY